MGRSIEAVQLEQELTHLFHETTYRVVKHPAHNIILGNNSDGH